MRNKHSSSTSRSSVRPALAVFGALLMLTASALAGDVAKDDPTQSAQTESVIYNFTTNYSNPFVGLTADAAGNLYGAALDGTKYPNGAVFELLRNQAWKETTLVVFNGKNGRYPSAQMVFDSQGNLYGSTLEGGDGPCSGGCGVIFELSPSVGGVWNYTILYTFQNAFDGQTPDGNLVIDPSGSLYGTTSVGQTTSGTVFGLKRPRHPNDSWTLDTLFTFNGTNGFSPNSLAYSGGALYGTTAEGGSSNYTGTVFELKPASGGWTYTLVYAFTGGDDGGFPDNIVASGTPNVLYGTAGGGESTYGVIFKITPDSSGTWAESVLYNFTGGADGAVPGPLTVAGTGTLFGTTNSGGDASACSFMYPYLGCGVVFEFVPSTATETVLHTFTGPPSDGGGPYSSGVVLDQGALYGTTYYGGNGQCSNGTEVVGCGTVYTVSDN
ncbi:MAG: choice-of-anchor tandem repeat GloVer-containing protein [Candidatus Sulfotelmatobacter sp.]